MTHKMPDRIKHLLKIYSDDVDTATRSLVAVSNSSDISDINQLRETIIQKVAEIQELKSKLHKELTLEEYNMAHASEVVDVDDEELAEMADRFNTTLTKFNLGKDIYSYFGKLDYFQQLPSNSVRYVVATQLCNYAIERNLKTLPLWQEISSNSGQLGE